MAAPTKEFDRDMAVLEGEMKRLEAEYNMYFSGRLPRLPWETRNRVEALVKRHDRAVISNTADKFRFQVLQTRYAKFCELWERQLRMKEEGRTAGPSRVSGGAPVSPPAASASAPGNAGELRRDPAVAASGREGGPDPHRDRLVHVAAIRDPEADADRVRELYERLAEAKRSVGEAPVPFDRVAALVQAQVQKLRGEGRDVAFRVALKDGKVNLTVTADGDK